MVQRAREVNDAFLGVDAPDEHIAVRQQVVHLCLKLVDLLLSDLQLPLNSHLLAIEIALVGDITDGDGIIAHMALVISNRSDAVFKILVQA